MTGFIPGPVDDPGFAEELAEIRSLTEEKIRELDAGRIDKLSGSEARLVLQQLLAHQVGLEAQNDELRRLKVEVDASRVRYFDLYNSVPAGCLTLSLKGTIQEANRTAVVMLGESPASILKRPFSRFIYGKDRQAYYHHRKLLFETGQHHIFELRMIRTGEEVFWARLESTVARNQEDSLACRVIMSDITSQKLAEIARQANEARVEHLNDVLFAMREVSRVLHREKDRLRLLAAVCETLVKARGYVTVWVGLTEEGSKRIVPVAQSGGGEGFLERLQVGRDEGPTGQGPMGGSIPEGRPVVCEDLANDPCLALWKEEAMAEGAASVASVPLVHRGRLSGVLAVRADRPYAFDAEELSLLEGLAADIVHGLQSLENELARRQAENEVSVQNETLEKIFENSPHAMMLLDGAGRVLKVNRAGRAWPGKPEGEEARVDGDEVFKCINFSDELGCINNPACHGCSIRAAVMRTFETQESLRNVEGCMKIRGGAVEKVVHVLLSTTSLTDRGSMAVLLTMIDISEQRETARALRENEERLRMFIEHAPVEMAMFDRAMRYLSVSRKWIEDFKVGGRDLLGKSHYKVFPCLGDRWKAIHRRILAGEILSVGEEHFEFSDGSSKWIRTDYRPWCHADGEIGGIVIFCEDTTELRTARESLRIERDMALRLGATADLSEAMGHLLEACLEFDGLAAAGGYLADRKTGELKLACHRGVTQSFVELIWFHLPDSTRCGEPRYWSRPVSPPELDELFGKEGLMAGGCIPIKFNSETIALLYFASRGPREIPAAVRFALENMAGHVGGVFERVRMAETIAGQQEELKETNGALRLLLKQRDLDRGEVEDSFMANIKNLIIPYLDRLKKTRLEDEQTNLLALLETNLLEIASPLVKKVSAPLIGLTPMEIRVADLIRQGRSSKEISDLLHISEYAVIFHRQNIRGKLRLTGKKLNLQTFLRSMS